MRRATDFTILFFLMFSILFFYLTVTSAKGIPCTILTIIFILYNLYPAHTLNSEPKLILGSFQRYHI